MGGNTFKSAAVMRIATLTAVSIMAPMKGPRFTYKRMASVKRLAAIKVMIIDDCRVGFTDTHTSKTANVSQWIAGNIQSGSRAFSKNGLLIVCVASLIMGRPVR